MGDDQIYAGVQLAKAIEHQLYHEMKNMYSNQESVCLERIGVQGCFSTLEHQRNWA